MKVVKVIKFENGEVIYKTDLFFLDEVSKEEMKELRKQAKKMYENGEFVIGQIEEGLFNAYYDNEGNFLGHEGIHITKKSIEKAFLIQNSKSEKVEKAVDKYYKDAFNYKR